MNLLASKDMIFKILSPIVSALFIVGMVHGQGIIGGGGGGGFDLQKPNLDDAVLVAGTSLTGADGGSWAYVVWNSPGAVTLDGKNFAIYLQTTPKGQFTSQGIVSPTAEPAALKLILSRAENLGENLNETDGELRLLLRRKSWGGNVDAHNMATNSSSFDNKSLAIKLSAVMGRVKQSADAASGFKMAGFDHPSVRMAMGRGWAGKLPAGVGPMTIEVRQVINGVEGSVVGRVTLTPGQGTALQAPGNVVQVPDLKNSGNLTIKLRWAVPNELRRQQQQVTGFHVYRISKSAWDASGISLTPTQAQFENFSSSRNADIKLVNDAPVPISKLYDNDNVGVFGNFGGDASTFFIADNNDAGSPLTEAADSPRRPPFVDGQQFYYVVRAIDLVGREGPPSPLGLGIACLTIPPDVPSGLIVRETGVGSGRHLKLSWKPNSVPRGVLGRSAQRYAIYRGEVPNGSAANMQALDDPLQFRFLTPLGYVLDSAKSAMGEGGLLTFTDETIAPSVGLLDHSVWYVVTALHDTPLDPPGASPHDLVESAPSPPAFGVLRDHQGPNAPTGGVNFNLMKLATVFDGPSTTAPRTSDAAVENIVHIRAVCRRVNHAPALVRFAFANTRPNFSATANAPEPPSDINVKALSPIIAFPPGSDEVIYEVSFLKGDTAGMQVYCATGSRDGTLSIIGSSTPQSYTASESQFTVFKFKSGRFSAMDFADDSTSAVAGTAILLNGTSFAVTAPNYLVATLPDSSLNGKTIIRQVSPILLAWNTADTAVVHGNKAVFYAKGSLPGVPSTLSYRLLKLPEGGDCAVEVHDPRPKGFTDISPVTVYMDLTQDTREWRIYRRVDGDVMTLVKSGITNFNGETANSAITADTAMPPDGARIDYYAQCFDQNQNPSPMTFLRTVILQPNPSLPVLSPPKSEQGNTMSLKWVCPTAGVKSFIIYALPLNAGDPDPTPTGVLTKTQLVGPSQGIALPIDYKVPGNDKVQSVAFSSYFEMPPLNANTPGPIFTATLGVTPNVPYVVWISAIGGDAVEAVNSTAQLFTWKAPPVQQAESIVPWPARPLPPVIKLPLVFAFSIKDAINAPDYDPDRSSVPSQAAANLYPVGILIGHLPFPSDLSDHSDADPMCATHPCTFVAKKYFNGDSNDPAFSLGSDPNSYLLGVPGSITPCVLYRQTLLQNQAPGALVQVSPLRSQISFRKDFVNSPANGSAAWITTILDPFIKTLAYSPAQGGSANFALVDTHSVEEGATYHYYLAHYQENGEIKYVIDCGAITIPETP